MVTFRSIVFMAVTLITIVLFAPAVVLARLFGAEPAYVVARAWSVQALWLCKLICRIDYTVDGSEHIPDDAGIVLMKHESAYETIAQWFLFPRQCWVLKRELVWLPFFGWALAALSPIAINRSAGHSAVEQVVEQGKQRLADGIWVMIFPEGTRMAPGQTRRYGISGALLARESNSLIVPVAHNAGDVWPRRSFRKWPGTIRFRIGPPIDPAGREPREINAEAQAWIEATVAELRSDARD